MNVFADSSALAKRYIADEASDRVDQLLAQATGLSVSVLCLPEIVSALCRRKRERFLTTPQYEAARNALEGDLGDATVVQITDEVTLRCVELLEAHRLRASDAIQIASALVWDADLFISADAQQCTAARAAGIKTIRL